jgi:hypothetical protein
MLLDGIYEARVDDADELATALLAGAAPIKPPKSWFENPNLTALTPLTITADGQVYGHVAAWQSDHIGLPPGTRPPRSRSNYAYFRTGVVETAEGTDIPVGQLTLAGGHAPLHASSGEAVKHYDDTASSVADLAAGEDSFGIWVSGGLRPSVSGEQIRAIRASAPSGDWRPINGGLEMVALCQVNVPGFPVARAMVSGGQVSALVAAGAAALYELRQESTMLDQLHELEARVTRLADAEAIVAAGKTSLDSLDESPEFQALAETVTASGSDGSASWEAVKKRALKRSLRQKMK